MHRALAARGKRVTPNIARERESGWVERRTRSRMMMRAEVLGGGWVFRGGLENAIVFFSCVIGDSNLNIFNFKMIQVFRS